MNTHLGPPAQKIVGEELRPELDLVPTPLLLKEVLSVQENLQRVGLVTLTGVQVSQPDSDMKVDFGEISIGKIETLNFVFCSFWRILAKSGTRTFWNSSLIFSQNLRIWDTG